MSIKKERIYRIFGKILFLLYIVFLIYFLFLAEWYGRTEVTEEYRYNLELFKEIRRFLTYREQLGMFSSAASDDQYFHDRFLLSVQTVLRSEMTARFFRPGGHFLMFRHSINFL